MSIKGTINILKNGSYEAMHPETECAQITDIAANYLGIDGTAKKAEKDSEGMAIVGVYGNAGSHNALYRGKDLTAYEKSGGFAAAIAAGTFDDIYPGDYILKDVTVDSVTMGKWIVGDCNYHLHRGDTETTANHVLFISADNGAASHMNATNTTSGGYIGSDMWKTTIPKYATAIQNAFGNSHVLSHRELLSDGESDTVPSGAGAGWTGGATGWNWYDVICNIFNETMVYGGRVLSSSFIDVGDCNTQVAAFRHNKSLSFNRAYWYWLRAVASSSCFCYADYYGGNAGYFDASASDGRVRPYFLYR